MTVVKRNKKNKHGNGKIELFRAMPKSENESANYWADFWELQCFFSKDSLFSMDELLDCIENDKMGDGVDVDMDSFDNDILVNESEIGKNLFGLMLHRKYLFGNNYPFLVNKKLRTISTKATLKENHKLYVSLLISSNISLIRPRKHHEWTTNFELFCSEKFKSLLPTSSKILNCGASNLGRSNLIKKTFESVAEEVRIKTTSEFDDMPSKRRGDLGVDLIGYAPSLKKDLSDRNGNVAFAQCACGRNWIPKQREVLVDILRKFFQFRSTVMSVIFIPHSFRNAHGTWEKADRIEHIVIVDRFRFFSPGDSNRLKGLFKRYYSSLFNQILKLDVEA